MADHRRVEPRGIMGSGMTTDPERVQQLEEETARKERAWREHEVQFGDVLSKAPAKGHLEDEVEPDGRKRRASSEAAAEEAPADATPPGANGAAQSDAKVAPGKPRVAVRPPPDPRAAALHKLLEQKQHARILPTGVAGETPPTGNVSQKKAPR
jgi:hypothetical protein